MSTGTTDDLKPIGPPKLLNFSCQVVGPNNGPAVCRLELKLEDQGGINEESTKMDLQQETLNTLLEGLTKVRDQLSSVGHHK